MMPTGAELTKLFKKPWYECLPKTRQPRDPGDKHQARRIHRVLEKHRRETENDGFHLECFFPSLLRHREFLVRVFNF